MLEKRKFPTLPLWMALVHLVIMGIVFVAYQLVFGVLMVVGIFAVSPELLSDGQELVLEDLLGPGLIATSAVLGHLTLVGVAGALSLVLPVHEGTASHFPSSVREIGLKYRSVFALYGGKLIYLVPALMATVAVGVVSGGLVRLLSTHFPEYSASLDLISAVVSGASGFGWVAMIFAVGISAPICEEIVFRGYFWSLFERVSSRFILTVSIGALFLDLPVICLAWFLGWGSWSLLMVVLGWSAAWFLVLVACLLRPAWEGWRSVTPLLLTSLLFMAFHMDFVQSLALAPTAFFLGWLRLMSGSIWPSIAAHFVNNSVAVIGILMMSGEPDLEMFEASPYVVVVSALIACAVSAGTWAFSRSREKAVVA